MVDHPPPDPASALSSPRCVAVAPAGRRPRSSRLARPAGAVLYIAFYTALDVLAGIGAGTLVQRGVAPNSPPVEALFDTGNGLTITVSFLIASAATATALVMAVGRRAWPGAAVLVTAAVRYLYSHIYWPVGSSLWSDWRSAGSPRVGDTASRGDRGIGRDPCISGRRAVERRPQSSS
jgi:hypothetical protein